MKVLIACEESQTVCKAFRERGHEAYSCDIQEPSGGHPEWHILGDALEAIKGGTVTTMDGQTHDVGRWDLLIAHPPCTYLTNAGAVRMRRNGEIVPERYSLAMEAKAFFMEFYNADIPMIAVENPTPMKIVGLPPFTGQRIPFCPGCSCYRRKRQMQAVLHAGNRCPFAKLGLWRRGFLQSALRTAVRQVGCKSLQRAYPHERDNRPIDSGTDGHKLFSRLHTREGGNPVSAWAAEIRGRTRKRRGCSAIPEHGSNLQLSPENRGKG